MQRLVAEQLELSVHEAMHTLLVQVLEEMQSDAAVQAEAYTQAPAVQVPTWLAVAVPTIPPVQVSATAEVPEPEAAAHAVAQTLLEAWQRLTVPHWELLLQEAMQTAVAEPAATEQELVPAQSALPLGQASE